MLRPRLQDQTAITFGSTGYRSRHASYPPAKAAASIPRDRSVCATRALVPSLGQVQ
jgi:hypothetical protein